MNQLDPSTDPFSEPDGDPGPSRNWLQRHWSRVAPLLLLVVLGIAAGPWLVAEFPAEIARWYWAAAQEEHLNDRMGEALATLEQAMAWNPNSAELFAQRSRWRVEQGKLQAALQDANRAVELAPRSQPLYAQRSEVYQHLGQHDAAIRDWKTIARLSKETGGQLNTTVLNGLAYARALGGTELGDALQDIETALEDRPGDPAMLDTRGYVKLLLGNLQAAKSDMDAAVDGAEEQYQHFRDPRRNPIPDPREFNQQVQLVKRGLAVMYYHRALVYQKLDEQKKAAADLKHVKELGFEPGDELF